MLVPRAVLYSYAGAHCAVVVIALGYCTYSTTSSGTAIVTTLTQNNVISCYTGTDIISGGWQYCSKQHRGCFERACRVQDDAMKFNTT
jgi:hypothetical protein